MLERTVVLINCKIFVVSPVLQFVALLDRRVIDL